MPLEFTAWKDKDRLKSWDKVFFNKEIVILDVYGRWLIFQKNVCSRKRLF